MKTRITGGSVNTRIVGRKQFQLEIPSDVPAIKAHTNDIGRDAILLAATTESRPDFVPRAIANTVGKKCIVFADVTLETLDMG